jgi:hypothetical protein
MFGQVSRHRSSNLTPSTLVSFEDHGHHISLHDKNSLRSILVLTLCLRTRAELAAPGKVSTFTGNERDDVAAAKEQNVRPVLPLLLHELHFVIEETARRRESTSSGFILLCVAAAAAAAFYRQLLKDKGRFVLALLNQKMRGDPFWVGCQSRIDRQTAKCGCRSIVDRD